MLYHLVRPVARYVLSYYYRNIDITGLANIPPNAAVILAANHPTAFIEPCLLACFQRRTLHFLARGDLYKSRLATLTLRALNILPVYRIQDGGYGKLTRNYDTFDQCYRALSKCQAIMILAEGRCIHEKRLRPLRKGTARIALGALDRHTTLGDVYIVPVGVNFTAAERCRSTVMIRCGEPLRTSDYLSEYRRNEAEGIRNLTEALRAALSQHVVQLPEEIVDPTGELRLTIARNNLKPIPVGVTHSGKQLEVEERVANTPPADPALILRYAAQLQRLGLRDEDLTVEAPDRFPYRTLVALVLLAPLLPLWLLGEAIALRGPKTIEFYSPVRFAAVAVGTLLYVPLLFVVSWPWKIYLVVALMTAKWSLHQVDTLVSWYRKRRLEKVSPEQRDVLRQMREAAL
ncbi:1-acyl-sn-glycerol-3-phosphate acyltransferase [Lewinella sp. IMCC34191]|uniref:1-acyl-sn-glycerol-3-phosphate acyltransferase n=1 Tax=Lewinella sp. IMCC34191 TaxID=2259172 RepID=UPI000E2683CD|nr:1-acyl-sn-glycerol-3-phosphate acyltransferase [Lewinella sp. IMCC34191]